MGFVDERCVAFVPQDLAHLRLGLVVPSYTMLMVLGLLYGVCQEQRCSRPADNID